jgi:hypothetical protein
LASQLLHSWLHEPLHTLQTSVETLDYEVRKFSGLSSRGQASGLLIYVRSVFSTSLH